MAGDYGDEAGEKMIDDFMRFGERMGEQGDVRAGAPDPAGVRERDAGGEALLARGRSPSRRSSTSPSSGGSRAMTASRRPSRPSCAPAASSPHGSPTPETGKEHLLFRIADAREVWDSFDRLGREAGAAAEKAAERLRASARDDRGGREERRAGGREPSGSPALADSRPLEERAEHARGAAAALEAQRSTTRAAERGARPPKARAR